MIKTISRPLALGAAFLLGASMLLATTETQSPSTAFEPYLEFIGSYATAHPRADIKALRAVEDAATLGVAQMVGIPDGMGAYDNGDGTFTILCNQEIGSGGLVRAHGRNGAFVSKWTVRKDNFAVTKIEDLSQRVALWNNTAGTFNAPATNVHTWSRFCSADVPAVTALYNPATGKGTRDRAIFNGEEDGSNDYAWAHVATGAEAGTSYQLRYLGRMSYENVVVSPFPQDKTVVACTDDGSIGAVGFYVGEKRTTGLFPEKAGLVGGSNYLIQVRTAADAVATTESSISGSTPVSGAKGVSANFTLGLAANSNTAASSSAMASGVVYTRFNRPEDGAWDPRPAFKNDFYFVCTASTSTNSRLYRLRFNDIAQPELGGVITCLLDGGEGQSMMDNLTVTPDGKIFIVEDPGSANAYAKVWEYDIATGDFVEALRHKPSLFSANGNTIVPPQRFTSNEESSGIVDVSEILGPGKVLLNVQAHTGASATTYPGAVEHGQMLLLTLDDNSVKVAGGGFTFNRALNAMVQTITVTNTGAAPVAGPVDIALRNLSANTSLLNATGTDAGTPYVTVSAGALAAGASVTFQLRFAKPAAGVVTYTAAQR